MSFHRLGTIVSLFFLVGGICWAETRVDAVVESRPLLGTVVTMEACPSLEPQAFRRAMDLAWQKVESVHESMNAYAPTSEVSRVNQSAGEAVAVGDDLFRLVRYSKEARTLTRGAFDITVSVLSDLWRGAAQSGQYPSKEAVDRLRAFVGADQVELLDGGRVRIPSGMKIDMGGNAPGFAADEAAGVLRQAGLSDFLIDVGGEIVVSGRSCQGGVWRVGTASVSGAPYPADVIMLKDAAMSTSGDQEKFFQIGKERFSRIIDPMTGYPVAGAAGVTVVAPTALEADTLSTALAVLGPQKGQDLVSSLGPGYAAMMIWRGEDGGFRRYVSDGYSGFLSGKK